MKVTILSGLLSLFLVSACVQAAEDPWVPVGGSADGNSKVLAKVTTLKKTNTSVSVLVQYLLRPTSYENYNVSYYKVSLTREACSNGYGKLMFTPISGDTNGGFISDYVADGESVGSSVGDNLCSTLTN